MRKYLPLRLLALFFSIFSFSTAFCQSKAISGVVKDENGKPLFGATITVKNTSLVTSTNADGVFKIDVPANDKTLVASYVGMESQEILIGDESVITINLNTSAQKLSDVVVVGYGKAIKANLSTAQVGVTSKQIGETINTTVEQALQGRAAGVYVTQNSGQPGGGMSVNIRGIGSLSGNTQPLYVIDGIQIQGSEVSYGNASTSNALSGLNPSDISDIQILQGPSATAIYGSRGTNGVILITTKRGKAGDFKINYSYLYNLQTPPDHLDVMNLQQYASMVKQYHNLAGGTTPPEFLDSSLLGEGTDWQKELFNNAPMNQHQLNLSGGSNNTTYYLSGEYLDQDGVAEGSGFKRYGLRLNLDNKPRPWLTIGTNLNFNQTNENLTATNYADAASPLIANALELTPQIPVTNFDGSWGGSDPVNGANQFAPINPIALASLITNKNSKRAFNGGLNIGITILPGLVFRSSFNGSIGDGLSTYYTPTYNIDQWHYNTNASLTSGTNSSWYWGWNQLLEYDKQIGKHNFTIMASHEAQESKYKALTAGRTGFLTNDIFDVDAGDPLTATNSGGTYPWSMESYLGRATYNYDNRYIVAATFRRDGSNNFGADKRWGNFPSVSAAWRISQEKFFNVSWMNELKLRLETGLTGNQGSASGVYSNMGTGATPWGTGFLVSNLKNPKLQWEPTNTYNLGLNVGLLNNKITFEGDIYQKKTDELLLLAPLPWYMGASGSPGSVTAPPVNIGALKTNGWAFTVTAKVIQNKDFKWESSVNLSHFKTIVTALNSDNAFLERTSWWMNNWTQRSSVGTEPWLFRGYIADGIFQSKEDIENSPVPVDNSGNRIPADASTGLWVGDVKYKDINGDGKITVDDMTNIGNPWPKLTGGFTNTFSYKSFDLSILIIGTYGNDVYNYMAAAGSNPNNINLSRNLLTRVMDYAKIIDDGNGKIGLANPETTIPRITSGQIASDNNFAKNSTRFVEDGSYLRLKNVSLSYHFPEKWLGYTKVIRGLTASIAAQNLFTLTNYTGYDPEVGAYVGTGSSSGYTGNQAIGVDYGRYPLTRTYSVAVSVNF